MAARTSEVSRQFCGPLLGGVGSALFGIRTMLGLTAALYVANMLWVRWKVQDPTAMDPTS
ncbi:hypothetical protein [Alicyclobacillus macrosporangiidus]|uniref:hypothetical protein n=1 Tax=Alicyclobacillus macrosporangiidus TaxID=392015 RepID=UPI000495B272|nr:hypothetical protein [Alicyclobacillus macrosporangiidus]